MATLKIENLHAEVAEEGETILRGVDLEVSSNEIHALMGPNGSGKSTMAKIIAGHPAYEVTDGRVLLEIEERAELLFDEGDDEDEEAGYDTSPMAGDVDEGPVGVAEFQQLLQEKMEQLDMDAKFMQRYLNAGFSGGEKKQNEVLQAAVLEPTIAVLDEIDSGLDIDRLQDVAHGINALRDEQGTGILQITHYQRILDYVEPDAVHIMLDGEVVMEGGPELAKKLEDKGYDWVRDEVYEAA